MTQSLELQIIDFGAGNQKIGSPESHKQKIEMSHKKMISPFNHSSRGNEKIRYIVIHDTGNSAIGADAIAHAKYFGRKKLGASAHYFVDDKGSVQVVADERAAWHCGDGHGKNGITNENSLGVEICINRDGNYDLAFLNAASLTKGLMKKHKISTKNVVRHFDASGKICPRSMSENQWEEWHEFKNLIEIFG